MTDEFILHKMGWCFTCDTDDCQHIQNANRSLTDALKEIPPPEGGGGQQRIAGGE